MQVVVDTTVIVAIAASIQIISTVGGGFYFFGRISRRLDEQDEKIEQLKTDLHSIRESMTAIATQVQGLVTGEAVQNTRLDNNEKTVDELRRGVGWITDTGARGINREYGR